MAIEFYLLLCYLQNQQIGNTVESVAGSSNLQSSTVNNGGKVQVSPESTVSHKATPRNYASKECGAKILFSNEEAQNTVSICYFVNVTFEIFGILMPFLNIRVCIFLICWLSCHFDCFFRLHSKFSISDLPKVPVVPGL